MSSSRNVNAFEKLAGLCTGYGGAYNPGHQNLQVEALITKLHNAQQVMQNVLEADTAFANAINNRQRLLKVVQGQSSRIMSVLKSSGVDTLTLYDAQVSFRKFRGHRKLKPQVVAKEGEPPMTITTGSGTDFASAVNHFAKLVEMISSVKAYRPTEPDLAIDNLEKVLTALREANEEVLQTHVQRVMARKKRNEIFYIGEDSLLSTMKAAKAYVRGVFGYLSTEHVQLIRLRFTKEAA